MSIKAWGLLIWALVVAVNAFGIGVDATLALNHLPTITDFARRNPWAACGIIAMNIAGLCGLMVHFSNGQE